MTPNEEVRDLLSRIWLFSELSDAELGLLAGITQKRRFEPRKPIVRQGDVDGDFYCVPADISKSLRVTSTATKS